MIEFISQPWTWYVSGIMISLVMFLLLWTGGEFGFSSNLRTMCSAVGAGKLCEFFSFDWKKQNWNLVFVAGTIVGGFIAGNFLNSNQPIAISQQTVFELKNLGINQGNNIVPMEIFNFESLFTLKGILVLVLGGFLVGFGSRFAGGCTSGHAISGLSNLQLPSLLAVIGFFIGGLLMNWFILPIILKLNF